MPYYSSEDRPRSSDPLVDAAWAGQLERVENLLWQGSDPNVRDDRGCSPLSVATRTGHVEVMRSLLAAGADAHEVVANRLSLLSLTVPHGHLEGMRLLLAAGADPNYVHGDDYTVLMRAAWARTYYDDDVAARVAMIRLLLDAGADVNAVADRGMTPLGCSGGEDEVVRILLEAGAAIPHNRPGDDPLLVQVMKHDRPSASRELGTLRLIAAGADVNASNEDGDTPLKQACALGSNRVVAALLESGARRVGATHSLGKLQSPELHLAADSGEPRVVRILLHNGADLAETDSADRTPLYVATVSGRAEVIKVLLSAGANPNAGRERGRSPLRAAAYHGHDGCVSLLIEAGADIDTRSEREVTALHLATLMRRVKVIPLLLHAGANVNARDAEGRTPLMWALRTKAGPGKPGRRTAETVGLLLAAGADPFAVDDRGQTALFDAARSNQPLEIRRLLGLGLDVNAAAHDGLTPLMAAAGEKDIDLSSAEALLAEGADVNAVDRRGATALHWMLRIHETPDPRPLYWTPFRSWAGRMLDLLVRAGAKVNRTDDRGMTPVMLAAQNSIEDLISPLLQAGADPGSGKQSKD
jgi:ankyrin repeat protein